MEVTRDRDGKNSTYATDVAFTASLTPSLRKQTVQKLKFMTRYSLTCQSMSVKFGMVARIPIEQYMR
jgi:hypothetical protein